jgi:glycerol uptake facilitator-like aquaporin
LAAPSAWRSWSSARPPAPASNPARWLGPALASGTYSDFWLYILGPVIGALVAAVGYRALVLDR